MKKMKFTAPNFRVSENMVQPIENIGKLKNQPAKNGAQVIENKVQPNFGLNENINGLKNQLAKNGAQVIENKAQSNFTFSDFFIEATY